MQLTYRGQTYSYSPVTVRSSVTDGATHTLFYRGSAYQCPCSAVRPVRLPGVINWRFANVA
ncbi:MAG: DUF4278 domain-containing protein [Leptolyngbya sp. BL-A-14]